MGTQELKQHGWGVSWAFSLAHSAQRQKVIMKETGCRNNNRSGRDEGNTLHTQRQKEANAEINGAFFTVSLNALGKAETQLVVSMLGLTIICPMASEEAMAQKTEVKVAKVRSDSKKLLLHYLGSSLKKKKYRNRGQRSLRHLFLHEMII